MRKPITATLALTLLTIVGGGAVTMPGEAQAYACKSYPNQSVGVRKGKIMARVAARKNWTANTKSKYGLSWSVYNIAKDKSLTCSYLQNQKKWRCLASAKPCHYVVQ